MEKESKSVKDIMSNWPEREKKIKKQKNKKKKNKLNIEKIYMPN